METPADHGMVSRLVASGSTLASAPWFSDAAHLASGGIPAVCIGPGSIDQAHTADEWIDVDALREGAAFFSRFLRGLAG